MLITGSYASVPELTVVGPVQVSRPNYLCSDSHQGQFPADVELDIENKEFSPGGSGSASRSRKRSSSIFCAVLGKPIPVLYVKMHGTRVPVVKKEAVGRQAKTEQGHCHTSRLRCSISATPPNSR